MLILVASKIFVFCTSPLNVVISTSKQPPTVYEQQAVIFVLYMWKTVPVRNKCKSPFKCSPTTHPFGYFTAATARLPD